jgi:nicotinamide phosphoribosyltransferase
MNQNILIDTDSYKASHWLQYPPGTIGLFNYMESRGGKYDRTVWFGLQYLLQEYLSKPITVAQVQEAETFFKVHGLPFNTADWMRIATELGGKIPLRIKAVPEGMVVPTHMPLLTAESTHPDFFWVVGWFETMLMRMWYPVTVATQSWHLRKTIEKYLAETSDNTDGLPFKLHDFGSRGVSSRESAAIGGAAHLVNFQGSDTVVGVVLANETYNAGMAGFSIPAAEHSTITSWGKDREVDAYANMIAQFSKPGSIYAVVSDSYNIWKAIDHLWGEKLRDQVIKSGGVLVVRPDSGDPVVTVNNALVHLDMKFGSKVNSKGYKVLNYVRVIQGDGLNEATIEAIMKSAKIAGYSVDNIAFGMGGALLQQVNRDTQKFAFKCSAVHTRIDFGEFVSGFEWKDVFKDPVDDHGKKSKAGRIGTKVVDGKFVVCADNDPENILQTRFENGVITGTIDFKTVRENARK